MWKSVLGKALATGYDLDHIDDAAVRGALERLGHVRGVAASWMPSVLPARFTTSSVFPSGVTAARMGYAPVLARPL